MAQSEIDAFVNSKQSWIDKSKAKMLSLCAASELTNGSTLPFMGENKTVVCCAEASQAQITESCYIIPVNCDIKQSIKLLLTAQAKCYIPARVKAIAEKSGISYSSVLINSAATHWGICTADRLHFSCYLMLADKDIIDYVITHELSHILHHNHSKHFWATVQSFCPNYQTHRSSLKKLSVVADKLKAKDG